MVSTDNCARLTPLLARDAYSIAKPVRLSQRNGCAGTSLPRKVIYLKDVQNLRVCLAGCATCASMSRIPRQSSGQDSKTLLIKRLSSQYGCSEVEVERSLSVFQLADRSGDGTIQREEFTQLVERTLQAELTPEDRRFAGLFFITGVGRTFAQKMVLNELVSKSGLAGSAGTICPFRN